MGTTMVESQATSSQEACLAQLQLLRQLERQRRAAGL